MYVVQTNRLVASVERCGELVSDVSKTALLSRPPISPDKMPDPADALKISTCLTAHYFGILGVSSRRNRPSPEWMSGQVRSAEYMRTDFSEPQAAR